MKCIPKTEVSLEPHTHTHIFIQSHTYAYAQIVQESINTYEQKKEYKQSCSTMSNDRFFLVQIFLLSAQVYACVLPHHMVLISAFLTEKKTIVTTALAESTTLFELFEQSVSFGFQKM